MQQLLRAGVVDAVGFWNSLARMEFLNGQTNTAFMIAKSGQYLANGYMWIPKGTPHPVLAQIFVNWRLSDEAQFPPESWGLEPGPWAELNEGHPRRVVRRPDPGVVCRGLLHLLPDDRATHDQLQVDRLGLLRRACRRVDGLLLPGHWAVASSRALRHSVKCSELAGRRGGLSPPRRRSDENLALA